MYKDLETWKNWEVGYVKSWDWRRRVDQTQTGLYPMLRGLDLSHGQWIFSEVLEVELGSRKTNLVALWKWIWREHDPRESSKEYL